MCETIAGETMQRCCKTFHVELIEDVHRYKVPTTTTKVAEYVKTSDKILAKAKELLTASGIPKLSPIQVLAGPSVA